ncbi:MAG: SDR family oxidoreductase [Actinomycetia bacterium]|nr:SDR family oxidoreductase [Actinomycetes bacterium]
MRRSFEEMTLNGRMIEIGGRMIEPEEIADAIAYLASPEATSTIGEILAVDGGYNIR